MRLYQLFHTEAEQKAWEAEHKYEPRFRVCMRMTAKEVEDDLRLDKGYLAEYQTATIYTYDD